jgi:hypothetical protein
MVCITSMWGFFLRPPLRSEGLLPPAPISAGRPASAAALCLIVVLLLLLNFAVAAPLSLSSPPWDGLGAAGSSSCHPHIAAASLPAAQQQRTHLSCHPDDLLLLHPPHPCHTCCPLDLRPCAAYPVQCIGDVACNHHDGSMPKGRGAEIPARGGRTLYLCHLLRTSHSTVSTNVILPHAANIAIVVLTVVPVVGPPPPRLCLAVAPVHPTHESEKLLVCKQEGGV